MWQLLLVGAAAVSEARDVFTNHFLVHVDGGHEAARRVARESGFVPIRPVLGSADEWHMIHPGEGSLRLWKWLTEKT